jgi:hypothetical protein
MTLPATARRAGPFNGNDATTAFPFTCKVFAASDLQVILTDTDGIESTLTLDSDYSVTVNGDQTVSPGGTINYPMAGAPLATGELLTAVGALVYSQPTDLPTGGAWRAEVVENALDRLTMLIQQVLERVDRTVKFPPSDGVPANDALPTATARASKFLAFDADGDAIAAAGMASVPVTAFAATLLDDATAAEARTTLAAVAASFSHADIYSAGTVSKKLQAFVSVKDAPYNAVGNGVADDTAAIQAAITAVAAAGGGGVYFPPGTYQISAQLNLATDGVVLLGSSRISTSIRQTTLNAKILNITANYCGFKSIGLNYSGTPVAGATAVYVTAGYVTLTDFVIRASHIGVHFFGVSAVAGKVTDFDIFDYESVGLKAEGVNDLFVARFIINAGNATRGALGGIRLQDKVEAFVCTDGDILLGVYSMTTDATAYALGTRPAYNNFTNVFFDSAALGTVIEDMIETEFVGCWFSGGRSGAGSPGCSLGQTDSLVFVATRFFNSGAQGCLVNNTAIRAMFEGCSFESNSVTAGAGVTHGLQFADNTADFTVIGGKAHNGLFPGLQAYGIFIGAGCTRFVVRDVQVSGNATGGIQDGSASAADKTIHGNVGYRTSNSGGATIPIGQAVVVVTHGLAATPGAGDIVVTASSSPPASGVATFYVTTLTATTFEIAANAVVGGAALNLNWQARIKGA